jgi:hypothetical protein
VKRVPDGMFKGENRPTKVWGTEFHKKEDASNTLEARVLQLPQENNPPNSVFFLGSCATIR